MQMTVAEAIIKYMQEEEGIEILFGYPGGAVISFMMHYIILPLSTY